MIEQKVSTRYARAILITAQETGLTETVLNDFTFIVDVVGKSKELRSLIGSPLVRFWKKREIFKEIFEGQISELSMKFLMLLATKNREGLILSIACQYESQYNILNNRVKVKVVSATNLNDSLKAKIDAKLKALTGKIILYEYIIDPETKGGFKVFIDDWVFDASLKNQLQNLYEKLANEVVN